MNDINKRNSNDVLSGNTESINTNSDTLMENEKPQTEHENSGESLQNELTGNEGITGLERKNVKFLDDGQMAASGSFLIHQNKNNFEQIEVSSHENMSTNIDNRLVKNELNDIDSASVVQSIGHILRRARMAKSMSVEDVSRQLRISVQQIEAIEKENFEKLPGRTFLRGFIRNYANLVRLDPIPLLQLLPESTPIVSTYERTPFKDKQLSFSSSRESSGNNWLVMIIALIVIVLGAYFIIENNGWNKKSDNNSINSEMKMDTEKASVEIQLPLSTNIKNEGNSQETKVPEANHQTRKNFETESNIKTEIIPLENKSIVKKAANSTIAANDLGNLQFKFTADSWIKVVDGGGASLLEQIRKGGTAQTLTGKRPLSIVLGNASGVNLTYNGTEVDISSYKRQDGTARFTLE